MLLLARFAPSRYRRWRTSLPVLAVLILLAALAVELRVGADVGTYFGGALLVIGLAYVYATAGTADLGGVHGALLGVAPTLPLAVPVLVLLGALIYRASLAPLQLGAAHGLAAPSPMSIGLATGLAGAAAVVAAVKVSVAVGAVSVAFSPYVEIVAALAMA